MNELGNQVSSAIVVSFLLEYLKKSSWFPVLTEAAETKIKVACGLLAATLTSVGISYSFDYSYDAGGHLVLALPAAHVVFDVIKQWAFQEFIYRTGVQKPMR